MAMGRISQDLNFVKDLDESPRDRTVQPYSGEERIRMAAHNSAVATHWFRALMAGRLAFLLRYLSSCVDHGKTPTPKQFLLFQLYPAYFPIVRRHDSRNVLSYGLDKFGSVHENLLPGITHYLVSQCRRQIPNSSLGHIHVVVDDVQALSRKFTKSFLAFDQVTFRPVLRELAETLISIPLEFGDVQNSLQVTLGGTELSLENIQNSPISSLTKPMTKIQFHSMTRNVTDDNFEAIFRSFIPPDLVDDTLMAECRRHLIGR
jgi:hypothetical protein